MVNNPGKQSRLTRTIALWLGLLLPLMLTTAVAIGVYRLELGRAHDRFEAEASLIQERIAQRINAHEQVLMAAAEFATNDQLLPSREGFRRYVKALDGVSLEVPPGRTIGIVGESGCGKSTLAKTVVGLEASSKGQARFLGTDITKLVGRRSQKLIQALQMVFQNPDSTMNPSYTVGQQIGRPLERFKTVPRDKVRDGVMWAEVHQEVGVRQPHVQIDERYAQASLSKTY